MTTESSGVWTKGTEWQSYPAVIVGSIWDEAPTDPGPVRSVAASAAASSGQAGADGTSTEARKEAIRKARAAARLRKQYEETHFAIVGVPPPGPLRRVLPRGTDASVPGPKVGSVRTRVLRNQYISQVGRYQFRLLHKLEGRWNGEATVYTPGAAPEVRVVAVELTFDDANGNWVERQSLTATTGLTNTQIFRYLPAGDGIVTVVSDDPFLSENVDMTLNEHSDNVLVLTALVHKTGQPLIVETVTVVDNLRRVRTVQRFDATGQFQCMYLIKEQRVIDAVSGAMESYEFEEEEDD